MQRVRRRFVDVPQMEGLWQSVFIFRTLIPLVSTLLPARPTEFSQTLPDTAGMEPARNQHSSVTWSRLCSAYAGSLQARPLAVTTADTIAIAMGRILVFMAPNDIRCMMRRT